MPTIEQIDDLIILGRACPEKLKDGRDTVCTAGYSHRLGFIRIYPTRVNMQWKRWNIVQVSVERDARDTRWESRKIAGAKAEWNNLHKKIKIVGNYPKKLRLNLVANLVDPCIHDINNDRRSLGIIKANILSHTWQETIELTPIQLSYFGSNIKTRRDYHYTPRIRYRCSDCKAQRPHDQQVLDWGFYEWLRKHPREKDIVWENAKFTSSHLSLWCIGCKS